MQRGRVLGKSEVVAQGQTPFPAAKGAPLARLGNNGVPTARPCVVDPTSPQVNWPGLMDVGHKETHWSGDLGGRVMIHL